MAPTAKAATDEVRGTEEEAFERYVERVLPDHLRRATGAIADAARREHRQQAAKEFMELIALGWLLDEIATGQLGPGAEVQIASGRVVRPPVADLSSEVMREARELAYHPHASALDPVLATLVKQLANGDGNPATAERLLASAHAAISQAQAASDAKRREQAERPTLRVHLAFTATGGREWPAGQYQITQAEADELVRWREIMEAQAAQHDWPAPHGYTPSSWPPFRIEERG